MNKITTYMHVIAKNPDHYVTQIPEDRQAVFNDLRKAILDNMPTELEEYVSYGMLGYVVPKSVYPAGYHCSQELPLPFVSLASQKNFIAFYHMGMYANTELYNWFITEYAQRCKYKIDMGKSCVRFKRMNDIPIDLIGELMTKLSVQDWISMYETAFIKNK